MSIKEIALSYLKQGLSVIPVTSPQMISLETPEKEMIEKCKRPLDFVERIPRPLPTEEEVCQWFDQSPHANIGIVTGKIPNWWSSIWIPRMPLNTRKLRADFRIRPRSRPVRVIIFTCVIPDLKFETV